MAQSVIVVSYRTGRALEQCLSAIAISPDFDEIVVADNGNSDAQTTWIDVFASAHPKLRVLRGHGNIGFAAACNMAVRAATGEYLLFVNPDVVLNAGAVAQLRATLDAAPAPAIVGGDLRDVEGRPDRGSRRDRVTLWRAFVSFSGLSRFGGSLAPLRDMHRHNDPLPTRPVVVGAVSGALMLMRRADFEAVGGFDEGYFLHVEDIDLCRRVEDAGGQIIFQPGPHGAHLRSSSEVSARLIAQYKARSFARYFRKFARNPLERLGAEIVAGVLTVLLPLRAR